MSDAVHERAANELGCSDVDVEDVGGQSYRATGCGRTATYTCVRTGYGGTVCEHDEPAIRSTPVATQPSPPVATATAAPSGGERRPPTGAGGFDFGLAATDAKSACEGAGHAFRGVGDAFVCDGFVVDLGRPGNAHLRFCTGKLCGVTLTFERNGETLEQSVLRWKRAVADKYGAPSENRSTIPPGCSDVGNCIVTHMGSVGFAWTWSSHESIELRVPARDNSDALRVELVYSAAQSSPSNGL